MRLRQAFEAHYDTEDLAPRTLAKYRTEALGRWERFSDDPPVVEIDNATVAGFRSAMLDAGLAPSTIASTWGDVRAILRKLAPPEFGNPFGLGIIATVPAMKPVKVRTVPPRRVSLDDLSRFYVACKTVQHPRHVDPGRWWRALLVVAFTSGLRRSDLRSLTWDQLDLDLRSLTFAAEKTGKADVFPLHPVAAEHLAQLGRTHDRVFYGMTTGKRFYDRWNAIVEAAGVERFTLHDVRRTGASEVDRVERGLGPRFLQHAPRTVSEKSYLNAVDELREAVEAMRLPDGFRSGPKMTAKREARDRESHIRAAEFAAPVGIAAGRVEFADFGFRIDSSPWFKLAGRRLALLRMLVEADGPVPAESIDADAKRAQSLVSHLRSRLRDLLGLGSTWDPVPCVARTGSGGRWTIHLPADGIPSATATEKPRRKRRNRRATCTPADVAELTETLLRLYKSLAAGPRSLRDLKSLCRAGNRRAVESSLYVLRGWCRRAFDLDEGFDPITFHEGRWSLSIPK